MKSTVELLHYFAISHLDYYIHLIQIRLKFDFLQRKESQWSNETMFFSVNYIQIMLQILYSTSYSGLVIICCFFAIDDLAITGDFSDLSFFGAEQVYMKFQ